MRRLISRKLVVVLAYLAVCAYLRIDPQIVVLAYLGIQGVVDRKAKPTT